MSEMVEIPNFFLGEPDRCERLISCLSFCCDEGKKEKEARHGGDEEEELYTLLEKGPFYRGMFYEFSHLKLVEQMQILLEKFTEFDSIYVPKTQIEMYRAKSVVMEEIVGIVTRISESFPPKNVSPIPRFYILIELGDIIAAVRIVNQCPFNMIILSENVTYNIVDSIASLAKLLAPCINSLKPQNNSRTSSTTDDILVAVNMLVLFCGSTLEVACLEEKGYSQTLESTLQDIRKNEKVHSLLTLRNRIECIEASENDNGDNGKVTSRKHSSVSPLLSREKTADDNVHISLDLNIHAQYDDHGDIVTTESFTANEESNSVFRSQVLQSSGCWVNDAVRSSLAEKIMESRGSEDFAQLGLRAYMAIRENVFSHKQDWGTQEEEDDDDEEEKTNASQMDKSFPEGDSELSLSGEFDIVKEMPRNEKSRGASPPQGVSESLDIDAKMKNYIDRITSLRESLLEDEEQNLESSSNLYNSKSFRESLSISQALPAPPTEAVNSPVLKHSAHLPPPRPDPFRDEDYLKSVAKSGSQQKHDSTEHTSIEESPGETAVSNNSTHSTRSQAEQLPEIEEDPELRHSGLDGGEGSSQQRPDDELEAEELSSDDGENNNNRSKHVNDDPKSSQDECRATGSEDTVSDEVEKEMENVFIAKRLNNEDLMGFTMTSSGNFQCDQVSLSNSLTTSRQSAYANNLQLSNDLDGPERPTFLIPDTPIDGAARIQERSFSKSLSRSQDETSTKSAASSPLKTWIEEGDGRSPIGNEGLEKDDSCSDSGAKVGKDFDVDNDEGAGAKYVEDDKDDHKDDSDSGDNMDDGKDGDRDDPPLSMRPGEEKKEEEGDSKPLHNSLHRPPPEVKDRDRAVEQSGLERTLAKTLLHTQEKRLLSSLNDSSSKLVVQVEPSRSPLNSGKGVQSSLNYSSSNATEPSFAPAETPLQSHDKENEVQPSVHMSSSNPPHVLRAEGKPTRRSRESLEAVTALDSIRDLMRSEKERIDDQWMEKKVKRSELRAAKGRKIFLQLQASAAARAKAHSSRQQQQQPHHHHDPIQLPRQSKPSLDTSPGPNKVDHDPDWMLNCDKELPPGDSRSKPRDSPVARPGVSQLRAMEDSRAEAEVKSTAIQPSGNSIHHNASGRHSRHAPDGDDDSSRPSSQVNGHRVLTEREKLLQERKKRHDSPHTDKHTLHTEHLSGNNSSKHVKATGIPKQVLPQRPSRPQSHSMQSEGKREAVDTGDEYYLHIPSDDSTAQSNISAEVTSSRRRADIPQKRSTPPTGQQEASRAHGRRGSEQSGPSSSKKSGVSITVSARDDSAEDERRRLAKFEQMRKKKLHEAALARQQKELAAASRPGYGSSYSTREVERRRINGLDSAGSHREKDSALDAGRAAETYDESDNSSSFASHVPRSSAARGGVDRPQPRAQHSQHASEPEGYLRQHEEESQYDRQIQQLEEEVATLGTQHSSPGVSSARKPRSQSANPSYRRPTASSGTGHESGRGDMSVRSEGQSKPRKASISGSSGRAVSAGRADARHRGRLNNAKQVRNALNLVCLAGSAHATLREETLSVIDSCLAQANSSEGAGPVQFLIVMHQSKMLSFKGLYLVDSISGDICKLTGRGPKLLPPSVITEYFKYESSSRSFRKLPTVSLTSVCDAVSLDPTKLKKSTSKKSIY